MDEIWGQLVGDVGRDRLHVGVIYKYFWCGVLSSNCEGADLSASMLGLI